MLVLQAVHGRSMAQTEFLVADRLSWMRFYGLGPSNAVPDANTRLDFREAVIKSDPLDALFTPLDRAVTEAGYFPMSGQSVDATLVATPRQRITDGETALIRAGETADNPSPVTNVTSRRVRPYPRVASITRVSNRLAASSPITRPWCSKSRNQGSLL